MMKKVALITGIRGQDGSYLADLLKAKSFDVVGISRTESGVYRSARLEAIDLTDIDAVASIIKKFNPQQIYHLADESFVNQDLPHRSDLLVNSYKMIHNLLEGIKLYSPKCRFFYAGSIQSFGKTTESPQKEDSLQNPDTIYGLCKFNGSQLTKMYREKEGMFSCVGYLSNHESPLRGPSFFTRKVVNGILDILENKKKYIELGNIKGLRDWSDARDVVQAMSQMLEASQPTDYMIGSGKLQTTQYVIDTLFEVAELEKKDYIKINSELIRKERSITLAPDVSRIKSELGWEAMTPLRQTLRDMFEKEKELRNFSA